VTLTDDPAVNEMKLLPLREGGIGGQLVVPVNHDKGKEIAFLTILRAAAALLVVWDHLVGQWLGQRRIDWLPSTIVTDYITTPFGIIQHFGFFAVVLFFLISGYIITHVAQREHRLDFLVKRLFRIYPPLIASIIVTFGVNVAYAHFAAAPNEISTRSVLDIVWGSTLLNYVRVHQNVVNGVAWSLFIEMLFYLLCFALLPLIQRRPPIASSAFIIGIFLVIQECRDHGTNFFLFSASVSYLPFLVTGQVIYYVRTARLRLVEGIVLLGINLVVLVHGIRAIHPTFYPPDNSYGVSFAYALAIFIGLASVNDRLRVPAALTFVADISYSLYLYHGAIGILLLTLLYPHVGYSVGLGITLIAVLAISVISWQCVEESSKWAARRLLKVVRATRAGGPWALRSSAGTG